ncbi:MAG: PhoH family protein [Burkholderiaceae bacterium]|jgi:PhoH-like ATPase|nr:PhoH family protein [Burkholderiaceae bacterium]
MPLPPAPGRRAAKLSPEAFLPVRGTKHADPLPDEDTPAAAVAPAAAPAAARTRKSAAAAVSAAAPKAARSRAATATKKTAAAEPAAAATTARQTQPATPVTAKAAPAARNQTTKSGTEAKPAALLSAPARPRRARTGPRTLFVLDTNVLLHDPTSLFRFEEHDIFLPMVVLEELDGHKKGMTEVARNGRQVSRTLDSLVASQPSDSLTQGLPLNATGQRSATGTLYFQTEPLETSLPDSLPQGKADNQILGVVAALRKRFSDREVVLVSKDINMRVKARALGLAAEDYQNDKVLDDGDLLYAGALALPQDFWAKAGKNVESWQEGAITYYRINGAIVDQLMINQFVYHEAPGEPSLFMRVTEIRDKTAVLKTLKDFGNPKYAVWGVTARNREQNFAMNLLMNPDIDLVTLTGTAGTGKTLLALAAGLSQVLDERRYTEIIMTRATVSVGEDIGFLPGTEEEKMGPWMGALDDNLEFLAKGDGGNAGEWGRAATNELIRSRIKIKSMNFMRGRTFLNKYVIIDEAQNLTPKQMKTLITRAGPGTKIICMGNLAQIDTPYLTEGSSGLTYAVDRFKGWPHSGHITLARGERSRLADFASEVL